MTEEREKRYKRQEEDRKKGLVQCDDFCGAKENPITLEEYEATLDHYKHHCYLSGCAHAC